MRGGRHLPMVAMILRGSGVDHLVYKGLGRRGWRRSWAVFKFDQ